MPIPKRKAISSCDTFEEEEPVDIAAVVKDLKVLETDM